MRSRLFKASIMLALMVATWALTSTAMQRIHQARAGEVHPIEVPPTKTRDLNNLRRFAPTRAIPNGAVARGKITSHQIVVENDGRIHVEAGMELYERTDPRPAFLWRLVAYQGPEKLVDLESLTVVQDHFYGDQKFQIPEGDPVMNPTFRDTLALPPGRYYVSLALYRFPRDFDHTQLANDEELAKGYQFLRCGEMVTVK